MLQESGRDSCQGQGNDERRGGSFAEPGGRNVRVCARNVPTWRIRHRRKGRNRWALAGRNLDDRGLQESGGGEWGERQQKGDRYAAWIGSETTATHATKGERWKS
jgi:hypothetical protein